MEQPDHARRSRDSRLSQRHGGRYAADAGYTLVELLIYSSLLVLILTVVGGMLLNTLTSQQKVLDSANANGVSQLIASSVSSGMRNATGLDLIDDFPDAPDDQVLVLTTVSGVATGTAADRVCKAWYFTESNGGSMYYQRGATKADIAATSVDNLAGWTLLGSGLSATGPAIFADANTINPAITLNFAVNANEESSPTVISTTFKTRQAPSTDTTSCF
jgi:hypothetical protein